MQLATWLAIHFINDSKLLQQDLATLEINTASLSSKNFYNTLEKSSQMCGVGLKILNV